MVPNTPKTNGPSDDPGWTVARSKCKVDRCPFFMFFFPNADTPSMTIKLVLCACTHVYVCLYNCIHMCVSFPKLKTACLCPPVQLDVAKFVLFSGSSRRLVAILQRAVQTYLPEKCELWSSIQVLRIGWFREKRFRDSQKEREREREREREGEHERVPNVVGVSFVEFQKSILLRCRVTGHNFN